MGPDSKLRARLCIINVSLPPSYGGAEIAAYRHAERYVQAGGEAIVVGPARTSAAELLPSWVIEVPDGKGPFGGRLGWIPGASVAGMAARVWPIIWKLRRRYDVLHIFNSSPLFNLIAVPLARLCGKPVILEMSLRGSDDPLRLRVWGKPGRIPLIPRPPFRYLLFRMGSRFVAKSLALRDAYLEAGLPEERLVQIPYPVDTRVYRQATPEEKERLRSSLGLRAQEVQILFVGGLTPRKGVHWLIEAFTRLPRDLSARLVLVGPDYKYDPEYSRSLRSAVTRAGMEDQVTFVTGVADNVEQYMRACDVFVLPSVREGLPISILEAMSSSLPIVASDIPEIARSQVADGLEGYLFPVGNVSELASILRRLVQNRSERVRLGDAARRRVESEFSADVVDERYRMLYGELLAMERWVHGLS
jgi:glycosyltransferase involved in cell wall biosynthesis